MRRRSLVFAFAALVSAAPALAADTQAHSGTLTAIDLAKHRLTLAEMGPWRGASTRLITRSIMLTPTTKVALVRRSAEPVGAGWPGGYVESPLPLPELHPGDFATVNATRHGEQLTAVSIDVVRASKG